MESFLLALRIAVNQFDYYWIVKAIENYLIENKEDKDCGLWQETHTILPNCPKVKQIVNGVKPIAEGAFWLVFNNTNITDEMQIILEKNDFWLIDYITKKDILTWQITEQ